MWAVYKKLSETDLIEEIAAAIANKKAIGWMQDGWNLGHEPLVDEV